MNILVTGAKGFVGSALVRTLVDDEHVREVVCLDVTGTPGRLAPITDRITLLSGGVGDLDDVVSILREHHIGAVAHMVYFAAALDRPDHISVETDTIAVTTSRVLEAARRTGVRRVVLPSSIHYYGPQWRHGDVWLDEECAAHADTLYGVGKAFIEAMARTYTGRTDMEAVCFRIPVVYGHGAKVGARGVNLPATAAATGQPHTVPYGPDEHICVAHLDDVGNALRMGLTSSRLDHGVYNIGGTVVSYRRLRNVAKQVVAGAAIGFTPEAGPIELPYLIDDSRLREELGFAHRPFEPAYRRLIRDMGQ